MKIVLCVLTCALSLAQIATGQEGKLPVAAILIKGSFQSGFTPLIGANPFEDMTLKKSVLPGAEIVFFPSRRLSFGAEVLGSFKAKPRGPFHASVVTDQYAYTDLTGKNVVVREPGREFAGYDATDTAKMTAAVIGNVYINMVTRGRVRPFIVGGFGIGFAERVRSITYYYEPVFRQRTGFKFNDLNQNAKTNAYIAKIGTGVSLHPAGPLVVRMEAGYRNGMYGSVGVGITF